MKPVRLGILSVSAHYIKRVHTPLQDSQKIEVYAIASRNEEKAKNAAIKFNIPKHYGSYQELLDDETIEMVYIPVPNHMHAEWIKKSADAGKHILCEKPMAMDAPETEAAIEYARSKGGMIMEAFMYRFHPQWLHAKNLIRVGEIGSITAIHTFFSYNNPDASNIRNIKEYGGGGMMDIGCYAISVPRFFLDREPQRLVSLLNYDPEFKTDILSSAILDFGKAHATFTVGTKTYPYQKVMIHGSSGNITIQVPFNTFPDVPAKIKVDTKIGVRNIEFGPADQYGLQFDAFAEALRNNKPAPTSPLDAINNMKVIDAIIKSHETRGWVDL
ncbi:MAG: Gfo/Idh/MocA family protein [Candidatus Cyclobacteriaceae bacterium M3_2C_046]